MKTSLADFDFLDPTTFIITCIAMFFVVMIRYFILSGFFHSYFYLWKKEEWKLRKINAKASAPPSNEFNPSYHHQPSHNRVIYTSRPMTPVTHCTPTKPASFHMFPAEVFDIK